MSPVFRPAGVAFAISILLTPAGALSGTVIVPDEMPSIQAAIDSGADTVLVRDGDYAEVPQAYRGLTLIGIGPGRPRLGGLYISNPSSHLSRRWLVRDFEFVGLVSLATSNPDARLLEIAFMNCGLRAGIRHDIATSTDPYDILTMTLSGCALGQSARVNAAVVTMDADTLDAGATFRVEESITVAGCWFRGATGTALDIAGAEPAVTIANNVIEHYDTGVTVLESRELTIRNNVIRHVGTYGIFVRGLSGTVLSNKVSECGTGMRCVFFDVQLDDNDFLRNRGTAVWLDNPDIVRAERNIFAHSDGFGMLMEIGFGADYRLSQNTFVQNKKSGLAILAGSGNRLFLQGNLFAGNAEWGLVAQTAAASNTLHCNNWYANGLGPTLGASIGPNDLGLNPFFCDAANDDFRLYSDSQLLGQTQCGQIGALGVGCSPPTLRALSVLSNPGGLIVEWTFDADMPVGSWLERADRSVGPWDSLATGSSVAANSFELLDEEVVPDREYHYRVAWNDRGSVVRSSPVPGTWAHAGELASVSPNPATGEAVIEWVLSRPGPTDIRVFDLGGRGVSVVARGSFAVGRHRARWDGRWEGRGSAPAGMYIVRITTSERTTSHRVLLLR